MRHQLKQLTSDSAIYGVSSIVGRFLNFLLVPFYTNFIPASEYGIVIVVYSYVAFLNVIASLGLDTAYMRYAADTSATEDPSLFSVPFLLSGAAGFAICLLVVLLMQPIAIAAHIPTQWTIIVPLAAVTLLLDTVNIVPFAHLRMSNRAKSFAAIKVASITLNVVLNVIFIAVLRESIVFIFVAGLAASLLSTLLLFPSIRWFLKASLNPSLLRGMLLIGLPTVPSGIAGIIVQVIDKPIMQHLTDEATVGIYGANYKLGIFMMLVVSMFQYAWQPFYLQSASDPNARPLFARVMTYFVLLGMSIVLTLSFFIEHAARFDWFGLFHLIHPNYWSGLGIVPIILFSYVFTGISVILNAGLLIQKRTELLPLITGAGALVNIVLNFLLIPPLGIYGGAYATLGAYVVVASISFLVTRNIYPVPYEYFRLLKIFLAAAVPAVLWYQLSPGFPHILWDGFLLVVFYLLLLLMKFFTPGEIREIRSMLARFKLVIR